MKLQIWLRLVGLLVVWCVRLLLILVEEMEEIVLKLFVAVALDTPKYQHFFVEYNPIHNKTRTQEKRKEFFCVFFSSSDPEDCVDE